MALKQRNIVVKAVTFILFGLLILSFAAWGIGDIFRGGGQVRAIAAVGDLDIREQDYVRTLSREINRLSARFGQRLDMNQVRALGLPEQVLGQMVNRALFDLKAADLGLLVTDEQVRREIQREPTFHDPAGTFDRDRFLQTLRVSGLEEQEYVESLRRDIVRQEIADAVGIAAVASEQLADSLYRYQEERRVARLLVIPNESFTDLPEPDAAELEAFHKDNADRFMAPERRAVTLVELRAEALAGEIAVSEEEVRAEFESRRDDFAIPERRTVEQMVFADEAATRAAAERLDGGAEFSAVAQELTGQAPVALGAVTREELPAGLAEVAFALTDGGTSAPTQSALGWHILRVTSVTPASEPDLEAARAEIARDFAMRQAVDGMISIANQLDDELAGGDTLEQAAGSLDLPVRKIDAIDRNGLDSDGKPVEGLPDLRFLEVAFATAAGEESLLTETDDGNYFVLRVDGVTAAELKPLADVRDAVAALWRDGRRSTLAREKAEALSGRAKAGTTLDALGAETGYEVITTEPLSRFGGPPEARSPALTSRLFQLTPGEVATVSGPGEHMVAQLAEIIPAEPAAQPEAIAELRDALGVRMQDDLLDQLVAALRGEYGVEVNQRLLEDVLATF